MLAAAGDCIVCHTAPGGVPNAGGRAMPTPFGTVYSTNLTPDVNTGLGIWTEDIFLKAMKTGKHFGTARDILPPIPWQSISKLTDDDLEMIAGKKDQLLGKLQKEYGFSKDRAEKELDEFVRTW